MPVEGKHRPKTLGRASPIPRAWRGQVCLLYAEFGHILRECTTTTLKPRSTPLWTTLRALKCLLCSGFTLSSTVLCPQHVLVSLPAAAPFVLNELVGVFVVLVVRVDDGGARRRVLLLLCAAVDPRVAAARDARGLPRHAVGRGGVLPVTCIACAKAW